MINNCDILMTEYIYKCISETNNPNRTYYPIWKKYWVLGMGEKAM